MPDALTSAQNSQLKVIDVVFFFFGLFNITEADTASSGGPPSSFPLVSSATTIAPST
ncbi:6243_t:CDS:2 [Gigaspora rosea]|nr:6243_t:CDS:2 [Gigaspora rosea]